MALLNMYIVRCFFLDVKVVLGNKTFDFANLKIRTKNTAAHIIPMILGDMLRERQATDMDMVCKILSYVAAFF